MNTKTIEFLNNLNTSESLTDYLPENFNFEDFDIMMYILQENGYFSQEIIYYHKAMEYLMKNDPSLTAALTYAQELGFEAKGLSSEVLATIHYQETLGSELRELEEEITDFFTNNN